MKHSVTTNVAHGCVVCRKVIRAGDAHFYDHATRNRYHVNCDPDETRSVPGDAPAQVLSTHVGAPKAA